MSERAMRYVIEFGDVWLKDDTGNIGASVLGEAPLRHVCDANALLAIAYDRESGTLHKTGSADSVTAWFDKTTKKFIDSGYPELAEDLVMVTFPVTPETVEEMNACRDVTGRVLALQTRLQEIVDAQPELLDRPQYPT